MSDSTLFLILSSWLLLFTSTSCKTIYYWSYDPISEEKLGEITNGRSWSLTGKDFGRQGGALETDSKVKWDPSASDSRKTYCDGTRQRRSLKLNIQAVLPKLPAGIPIDDAATRRLEALNSLRIVVTQIFNFAARDLPQGELGDSCYSNRLGTIGQSFLAMPQNSDVVRFNPKAAIENAKNADLAGSFEMTSRKGSKRNKRLVKRNTKPEFANQFIFIVDPSTKPGTILLLPSRTPLEFYGKVILDHNNGLNLPYCSLEEGAAFGGQKAAPSYPIYVVESPGKKMLVYANQFEESWLDNHRPNRTNKSHVIAGDANLFLLAPGHLLELAEFESQYTMFIPPEVQKSLFPKAGKLLGIDEEGQLKPSMALKDKSELWRIYFETFTRISEAQTDDPQIIRFEAELDLAGFCAYGRRVSDLLSK